MFGIGTTELVICMVICLILFGNRLPSVMRSLGRGVVEFKKGLNDPGDAGDPGSKKIEESASKGGVNQSETAANREEAVEKK